MSNADLKLRVIPYALINLVTRVAAKRVFKKIEGLALNYTGSAHEAMRSQPGHREFYDLIEASLTEYFS